MERCVDRADEITVSNRFLQNRFGGELVYHCRDTSILDPGKFSPAESKHRLCLEGKKVLMFLGTPREHKGIDDLIQSMDHIRAPQAHLAIVGAGEGDASPGKKNVTIFPRMPFAQLGETLAAADIVIIPQRHTSDTVGQMPAKIFDAMSMAKPIISTPVSDIPEVLGGCGYLVEPGNVRKLAETADYILSHEEEAREKGRAARRRCVELYDIKKMEEKLAALVGKAAGEKRERKK